MRCEDRIAKSPCRAVSQSPGAIVSTALQGRSDLIRCLVEPRQRSFPLRPGLYLSHPVQARFRAFAERSTSQELDQGLSTQVLVSPFDQANIVFLDCVRIDVQRTCGLTEFLLLGIRSRSAHTFPAQSNFASPNTAVGKPFYDILNEP